MACSCYDHGIHQKPSATEMGQDLDQWTSWCDQASCMRRIWLPGNLVFWDPSNQYGKPIHVYHSKIPWAYVTCTLHTLCLHIMKSELASKTSTTIYVKMLSCQKEIYVPNHAFNLDNISVNPETCLIVRQVKGLHRRRLQRRRACWVLLAIAIQQPHFIENAPGPAPFRLSSPSHFYRWGNSFKSHRNSLKPVIFCKGSCQSSISSLSPL